eukprot:2457174-Rhodomonas_salina.6
MSDPAMPDSRVRTNRPNRSTHAVNCAPKVPSPAMTQVPLMTQTFHCWDIHATLHCLWAVDVPKCTWR